MPGPDKFDVKGAGELKRKTSSTKRVAMIIFIASGILMTLVMFAIMSSGRERTRSAEPRRLEPAQDISDTLERASAYVPEPEEPEPQESEAVEELPDPARPRYVYMTRQSGNVSDQRKEKHQARMLAANSTISVSGFADSSSRQATGGEFSEIDPELAALERERAESQRQYEAALKSEMDEAAGLNGGAIAQARGRNLSDPNGWEEKDRFVNEGGKLPDGYSMYVLRRQLTERVYP